MAKVLVIDDDTNLLEMLAKFLTRQGWSVLKASTGTEGLRLAQESKPDIVLSDVVLPDLGGLEFAQKLRGAPQTAQIPLVLITGHRKAAEDILKGMDAGAQSYILKPVDLRLVHAKLEAVLRALG